MLEGEATKANPRRSVLSHWLCVRQRKSVHVESYNIGCCGCEDVEGEDDAVVGVGATILPAIEGQGVELTGGAVGLGDGSGEATISEKGLVGPPTRMGSSRTQRSAL